jgi:hypothetical protein
MLILIILSFAPDLYSHNRNGELKQVSSPFVDRQLVLAVISLSNAADNGGRSNDVKEGIPDTGSLILSLAASALHGVASPVTVDDHDDVEITNRSSSDNFE